MGIFIATGGAVIALPILALIAETEMIKRLVKYLK
jgi:hypothetical protein